MRLEEGLDIQVYEETKFGFKVYVPPYRVDVQREADVIEEIARIYGFDNIEFSENLGASYLADFPSIDANQLQQKTTEMLASNGQMGREDMGTEKAQENAGKYPEHKYCAAYI